ncbi:carboxylesterase/lipase family protein [Sphingomonas sp. PB2P19]|uniref:carboxylesterase/lipase family protein n=1 Tax=Sphingomonas rhamnosi TaxID=3096156 RepID=UPI003FA70CAE
MAPYRWTILLSLAVAGSATARGAPDVVITDTGAVRGATADGVVAWKGIPFAAPPVGALRWRAPQPAARWDGMRDARAYGHDCMQLPFPSDAAPLGTPPAEDCLYINVWKPVGARRLPVLVWIYGGGFVNGGSSPPTYAGTELAKQGIMVVSFNYRLGRFGTFAHPQLSAAREDAPPSPNFGYMDQVAALRWVHRNIAAFGGDPANVTIVGESAGGVSVHALVTAPIAQGLFTRAVVQSGGPIALGDASPAAAQAAGLAFAASKGIAADDPQASAKLRALSADAVTDGLNLANRPSTLPVTYSAPVVDGRYAVDQLAAYRAGAFKKVPMMLGATSDDIGGRSGPMIVGARNLAGILAAQNVPTYYYRFSYVATSARTAETRGASHASDIPFFFDTAAIKYGATTTPTDRAASRTASGYLVNFVKTGNPNAPGASSRGQPPLWPAYDGRRRQMLDLNAAGAASVGRDPWDTAD